MATIPLATTLLQRLGDPLLLVFLAGMAVYGFRSGVFLATLAALQVLAGGLVAIGLVDEMSEIATLAGCPEPWCGVVGFLVVFLGVVIAARLAIGAAVPEDAVRFVPSTDSVLGGLVGALGGLLLCGAVLVAWTMAPVPDAYRLDPSAIRLDLGPRLLSAIASLASPDADAKSILLSGEPLAKYVPPEPKPRPKDEAKDGGKDSPEPTAKEDEPPPVPPLVGEPFADENGNGLRDEGEPYLDVDASGDYTAAMTFTDSSGDGRRDIGLLERYRVGRGRWDRVIVVPPPPPPAAQGAFTSPRHPHPAFGHPLPEGEG